MLRFLGRSMLHHRGYIQVCEDIFETERALKEKSNTRVVSFVKEKFLVEDAKELMHEAYITEEQEKILLFGGLEFNHYAQNALLKILEEPPSKVVFILLTPSLSMLLPTIRSRLIVQKEPQKKELIELELNLKKLSLEELFSFVNKHKNDSKQEAKELTQALFQEALKEGIKLSKKQLEHFEISYKLLDLNTRVANILTLLLMGFLYENSSN